MRQKCWQTLLCQHLFGSRHLGSNIFRRCNILYFTNYRSRACLPAAWRMQVCHFADGLWISSLYALGAMVRRASCALNFDNFRPFQVNCLACLQSPRWLLWLFYRPVLRLHCADKPNALFLNVSEGAGFSSLTS